MPDTSYLSWRLMRIEFVPAEQWIMMQKSVMTILECHLWFQLEDKIHGKQLWGPNAWFSCSSWIGICASVSGRSVPWWQFSVGPTWVQPKPPSMLAKAEPRLLVGHFTFLPDTNLSYLPNWQDQVHINVIHNWLISSCFSI